MATDRLYPADQERGPISDHELERIAIATLLTSYREVADTKDILTEECFSHPDYQEIFRAVNAVFNRGDSPDMYLVSHELGKMGSEITSLYVTELCLTTPQTLGLREHALILRDYARRRRLWSLGYRLLTTSGDVSYSTTLLQSEAKDGIDGLFEEENTEDETLYTAYKDLQAHMLVNRNLQEGEVIGTPTGFQQIDSKGGLTGGQLIVVGAETSQGKTAFATALSVSAIEHGHGVAFYSMEMTPIQLTARIASMRTGIPASSILFKKLAVEEILRIDEAMEGIDTKLMHFDSRTSSSLDSILMSIRTNKIKHNIKGAVVDYLQLIDNKTAGQNREQAVAQCSRSLKRIALELDIWIIAISQLSRNQQNPLPTMSRLRDSGQIEQDADSIFLIYRPCKGNYPEPFANVTTHGTAMVMMSKGRNTGTDEFICGFNGENTLFYPLEGADTGKSIAELFGNASPDANTYGTRGINGNAPF